MSHKAAKIGVTTLVLATVFGVLLYTTLGESMQYYKYVDEVVGSQSDWTGKKLQVHGYVVPGSIGRNKELKYRFDIQRNGKTMRAFYTGIVPDTFKDDSEVVLTGVEGPGEAVERHPLDGSAERLDSRVSHAVTAFMVLLSCSSIRSTPWAVTMSIIPDLPAPHRWRRQSCPGSRSAR